MAFSAGFARQGPERQGIPEPVPRAILSIMLPEIRPVSGHLGFLSICSVCLLARCVLMYLKNPKRGYFGGLRMLKTFSL